MALVDLLNRDDLPEDARETIRQALEVRVRSEEESRERGERQRGLFKALA